MWRGTAAVCAALILVPLAVAHLGLRASLPGLDGTIHRQGVGAAVTIDRDARGVPTIEAANRADLAYGLGFVHGQDRFFQMDLSRRLAAGELSELFGRIALEQDERARVFGLRRVALGSLGQASPAQRAVLEAYARGVNAGLASLGSRPWEYWVLRSRPIEWRPQDTILVSHAMWWDLQYGGLEREILRRKINQRLRGPECEAGWKCALKFLYPSSTEWDAPNAPSGAINEAIAIPPPEALDVRGSGGAAGHGYNLDGYTDRDIGSNNWAVAGRLTSTGSALIANDMHLGARVPTVWYRARMRMRAAGTQPALDLNGVTLPGAPLLVAGSNGSIAWGFTNSYGNWLHVEQSACAAGTSVRHEQIRVQGGPSVDLQVISSPAGVLYETDPDGRSCWFVAWLVQQPAGTNLNLLSLERAASVTEALDVAPLLGIPHQNFVVGDRAGHIAWTIAGRIPAQSGASRALGAVTWAAAGTQPRIVDPDIGRIWTANARATDDPAQLAVIGGVDAPVGADYDLGARARQIRDDLLDIKGKATPLDMLNIQLDDRAVFLTRWRALLLDLLDARATAGHPERAQFRHLVETWDARAGVDSVGYRLVRTYHEQAQRAAWEMMLGALGLQSDTSVWVPSRFEGALWRLVSDRPPHLLSANYADWRQFLLSQVDATLGELRGACPQLASCTWGSRNAVRIQHPLSHALPFLSRFLDLPTVLLPGDHDMPRVQDGTIGASERFAVSPGHEDQGYIHIPGGQSGHPLSPYYRAGFMDWVHGVPAPFLPGAALHRLTLESD